MFKKRIMTFVLCFAAIFSHANPIISPWEHQAAELSQNITIVPGSAPIQYTGVFTRERELYGYNPRFMPWPVFFDKDNRPYMLAAVPEGSSVGDDRFYYINNFSTEQAYIQTLDDNGNWVAYDVISTLKNLYAPGSQYYFPKISTGYNLTHRIFFDDDNRVFVSMCATVPNIATLFLCKNANEQTWEPFEITGSLYVWPESFDTFTSSEKEIATMPTKLRDVDYYISLYKVNKLPEGGLILGNSERVVDTAAAVRTGEHSGYLNSTVTVGDYVHFVWLDSVDQTEEKYTKQYHTSYNRRTGKVQGPHYMGATYGYWPEGVAPADVHNAPSITVDRNKVLHVVLGGHGSQAKYTYSTDQGQTWAPAVDMPGGNAYNTYPTLITDRENTLHLVYRCTEPTGTGRYKLAYSRKKAGQAWQDMGALVSPGNDGYSVYYHKMTVDRLGRLFLHYYYHPAQMSEADKAEYRTTYPSLPDPDTETLYTFDPVIIMTDNGGDTWKIATTADFAVGLINDTVPVAVYDFGSADKIGLDMAGYDNNLDTAYGSPSAINGVVGGAVSFNGTADGLTGEFDQGQAFADGAFTVVGWFKPDAEPLSVSNVVDAKTGERGFALKINNGQWIGYTYADGYIQSVIANTDTSAGQWVHIAFTYQPTSAPDVDGAYSGTSKLYIGGQLASASTGRKYNPQGAETIALAMSTAGSDFFACSVDELGIFSGAMPVQKIAELAANEFRPSNVSRELLYKGDFNRDGLVNVDDLMYFVDSWMNAE